MFNINLSCSWNIKYGRILFYIFFCQHSFSLSYHRLQVASKFMPISSLVIGESNHVSDTSNIYQLLWYVILSRHLKKKKKSLLQCCYSYLMMSLRSYRQRCRLGPNQIYPQRGHPDRGHHHREMPAGRYKR